LFLDVSKIARRGVLICPPVDTERSSQLPTCRVLRRSLDPLPRVVLVVLSLDRAPGNSMSTALVMTILVPRAIERFLVDVLRVRRQVLADALGKIGSLLVWHLGLLNPRWPHGPDSSDVNAGASSTPRLSTELGEAAGEFD
jgi:hypothetical protein